MQITNHNVIVFIGFIIYRDMFLWIEMEIYFSDIAIK